MEVSPWSRLNSPLFSPPSCSSRASPRSNSLTQYNPNGVFIALEELGYLLMSLVFLCLAPAFVHKDRLERVIRWLLTLSFAATVVAFVVVSGTRGIDRGDLFEIIVISIVWLTLIVAGPLLAIVFRRAVHR